jgi:hypothetical protein
VSSAHDEAPSLGERKPFDGGGTAMMGAAAVGVLGLAATAARAFMGEDGKKVAVFAYLVGFAYWLGLALAALILVMIWNASKGRWMTVVRRTVEVMAGTMPLFLILFVPIVLGMKVLYPWAGDLAGLDEESLEALHHRAVYLNTSFFLVRAAIYFVIWIGLAEAFLRWSRKQDTNGDPVLTAKAYWLGPAGLPFMGLSLTFAAIDWLQSLGTKWFSSMWGVYYFAGSIVACFGLLIILTVFLERGPALSGLVRVAHWLSLGKFLLAFTCFWAYISFSQYMLTWVANLPDTVPWILQRSLGGWQNIKVLLIVGHFAVPFLILLQRSVKMNPPQLAAVALWILFIHYVDLYWVVMPQVMPDHPIPDWSNITAFAGVGGLAVAFGIFRLRGTYPLPVRDPYLADSLSYSRMM